MRYNLSQPGHVALPAGHSPTARSAAPFGGLSLLLVEKPPTIPLSDTATTPAKKMMAPTRFGLPLKYSLGSPTTRPLADRLTASLLRSPIGGVRRMPGAVGLEGGNSELGKYSGPCESRSRHLRIKRAFPNVATVPIVSQRVLFSQVIGSEYEDGWDAAHRLATQKDGIVGSNVGQKVGHGRRDPDNATTRVKASPTGTCGLPKLPVEPLDNRQYRAA